MHKFAKRSRVGKFYNERTWSTPLDSKLMFGAFQTVSLLHESDAKLVELTLLVHKFAKLSCVGIFRNERTGSIPLDPKLMFWTVSDRFVTARKSLKDLPN
jgi:hypothetical protein